MPNIGKAVKIINKTKQKLKKETKIIDGQTDKASDRADVHERYRTS